MPKTLIRDPRKIGGRLKVPPRHVAQRKKKIFTRKASTPGHGARPRPRTIQNQEIKPKLLEDKRDDQLNQLPAEIWGEINSCLGLRGSLAMRATSSEGREIQQSVKEHIEFINLRNWLVPLIDLLEKNPDNFAGDISTQLQQNIHGKFCRPSLGVSNYNLDKASMINTAKKTNREILTTLLKILQKRLNTLNNTTPDQSALIKIKEFLDLEITRFLGETKKITIRQFITVSIFNRDTLFEVIEQLPENKEKTRDEITQILDGWGCLDSRLVTKINNHQLRLAKLLIA